MKFVEEITALKLILSVENHLLQTKVKIRNLSTFFLMIERKRKKKTNRN